MSLSKDLQDIVEIINKINPEILHLGAAPEFLALKDVQNLKKQFPNLRIMRSIPVNDEKSVELAKQYSGVVDYLLLDTQEKSGVSVGATGETHDWSISKKIVESVGIPVILAGGLGPNNVAEAIKFVKPFGVDSKTKTDKLGDMKKTLKKSENL